MAKQHQFRKPKYETDYSKQLSRKVYFKPNFILTELKVKEHKEVKGSGHVSDETTYDNFADLRDRVDDVIDDPNAKVRLFYMIYRMFNHIGFACCLLRKIVTLDPLTVKKIDEYLQSICGTDRIPNIAIRDINCLKYNEKLIDDINRLLPSDYDPETILDIHSTEDSLEALRDRFPKAKVYNAVNAASMEKNDITYDLIILSHYLHHLKVSERDILIKTIVSKLNLDGYLFIREMDVETNEDIELSNFIHEVFYKSRISTISYLPKEELANTIKKITNKLEFQSESHNKNDVCNNPMKNYFTLFRKINAKELGGIGPTNKPRKIRINK